MNSLVLELQQDALNPEINLADLLRKALLVSRKLGINDFQIWIEKELDGYQDNDDLPEYRKISGTSQCLDPFRGWLPIQFHNVQSEKYWTIWTCKEPISQFVAITTSKLENDFIQVFYSAEGSKALLTSIGRSTQVRLIIGVPSIVSLLDSVRTIVLKWAMKLEEDNILGEGMTFTPKEKSTAKTATYNVTNFYGPVGSSQIQQQTSSSGQSLVVDTLDIESILRFLTEIKENMSGLQLSSEMEQKIKAEVDTIDAQVSSPKPKVSIVRESLSSIRRILEGAGGAIAAKLLFSLILASNQ
jgi:hypothetical protein